VSLTPLKRFQRCQWHRWNSAKKNFCGWNPYDVLNFTIMVVSAVSLIPLKPFQQCHWHHWKDFCGVIDTAETISVVSLTPLKRFQRCHWHQGNSFSGVIDTTETRIMSIFSANTKPYTKWNGFSLWVRALGGIDWWKKTRGQKSRDTVPLTYKTKPKIAEK
jgi:hypothetical protein